MEIELRARKEAVPAGERTFDPGERTFGPGPYRIRRSLWQPDV